MPKFGGARISPAAGRPKTLSFLFVCLFVKLLNIRDCAPDFAMKALEYRNDFDAVGWGKVFVLVVHRVQLSQAAANWRHH